MSQHQLSEHARYLGDERKVAAYRQALAEVIQPGDTVLDLGAGTGLLGLLACEAGAERVIAVDAGDILELAQRLARANGLSDRIQHIERLSSRLELPEPVDVVVSDQIGGMAYDAGVLVYHADAASRLAAPDARFVPSDFRLYLAPVSYPEPDRGLTAWTESGPSGLDLSPVLHTARNTLWSVTPKPDDVRQLASPRVLAEIASTDARPLRSSLSFEVDSAGTPTGWLGWFEARLSPSSDFTNSPWSPQRLDRWCSYLPIEHTVELQPGDAIEVTLDIRPKLAITTWDTTIRTADGTELRSHQSTFYGQFLTRATVNRLADGRILSRPPRAELAQQVLELADGSRSRREIEALLGERAGSAFTTDEDLHAFVRDVLAVAAR